MEKLREAFEKRAIGMSYDLSRKNETYIDHHTVELFLGYMMCNQDHIDIAKHETVEQWEERTGETYPDDGPVWRDQDREARKHSDSFKGLYLWKMYEYNGWYPDVSYIANHRGKPDSIEG